MAVPSPRRYPLDVPAPPASVLVSGLVTPAHMAEAAAKATHAAKAREDRRVQTADALARVAQARAELAAAEAQHAAAGAFAPLLPGADVDLVGLVADEALQALRDKLPVPVRGLADDLAPLVAQLREDALFDFLGDLDAGRDAEAMTRLIPKMSRPELLVEQERLNQTLARLTDQRRLVRETWERVFRRAARFAVALMLAA